MNDFERAIWGLRKKDRYVVDSGKESSSLLGYAEESIQSSNKAPSQPIIFQPPQTIGRRIDPEKKQEEKQEKKENQGKKQKHKKNDWEKIRLAIAAEESVEKERESEEQAESGNDMEELDFITGDAAQATEANNSQELNDGGFLKAIMRDNSSVCTGLHEDSEEESGSVPQAYDFPGIDWLEAALEGRKSNDRPSLGSFPYSCPDTSCEKRQERKVQSFNPGGIIRKPCYSIAKLPVCLASVNVQLDLNRTLDLPFPVSQLNEVEWELTAVKGKVILPDPTVFMELMLTATIEVVCDDRLQLIKVDVPVEKTFQADWIKKPVVPYSKSREYMFLCPKRKQISVHRESYQKLAEEIQFFIPAFQITWHELLATNQDKTGLTVTGHMEAKLALSQSQYVNVINM